MDGNVIEQETAKPRQGPCRHRRQVGCIALVNGIAEFEQSSVLPCANPDCPETWRIDTLVINHGARFSYERYLAFDGWRWVSSGDRSVAEEREACAKIADRHPNGRERGCQCNACKSGREIRARAGVVVDEAALWRERALKAEAQLFQQTGNRNSSPGGDMDEEGIR